MQAPSPQTTEPTPHQALRATFSRKGRRRFAHLPILLPLIAITAGLGPVIWLGLKNPSLTFDPYLWRVLHFTLVQAGLSTIFSLALGLPFALALSRQEFPGRGLLVKLLALPLALPAIVASLGIIAIFGAQGLLGGVIPIYGLTGILIAHVFFNFPLIARLALAGLDSVPDESRKLASQLSLSTWQTLRHLEWPAMKPVLPGAALLVFLLCAASFTVVLTLGGGPQATTLEVAIYQSLRLDFDPARATALSLIQIALCAALIAAAQKFPTANLMSPASQRVRRYSKPSRLACLGDTLILLAGAALLLPPLAATLWNGLPDLFASWPVAAFMTSIAIAASAGLLAALICWPLASAAARSASSRNLGAALVLCAWILPPAVIATGWFILLNRFASVTGLTPLLIIALNALMALPFCYNALAPAMARHIRHTGKLCASLGISGTNRLRLIDLPALRKPLALSLVMAAVVSLGDLTAVLFFGSGSVMTLPALIYAQMGSYRMGGAAGTSLLLALLALALLTGAERLSRHD